MTPQEKAKELVNKFMKFSSSQKINYPIDEDYSSIVITEGEGVKKESANKCALICVDEILKEANELYRIERNELSDKEYWQEIKQEIEKL